MMKFSPSGRDVGVGSAQTAVAESARKRNRRCRWMMS